MGPEEAKYYLNNIKRGQHPDLAIRVPVQGGTCYLLTMKYVKNILELMRRPEGSENESLDLFKALSGIIVFGSAVNAKYHTLTNKWLWGLIKTTQQELVYEKERRPNDLDVIFIFDEKELQKQQINVGSKEEEHGYFSFVTDIQSEYYYSSGYGTYTRIETKKGELDLLFVSDKELQERLKQGCAIAHHIRDIGVLAIGESPVELRNTNFFSATKDKLTLNFAKI